MSTQKIQSSKLQNPVFCLISHHFVLSLPSSPHSFLTAYPTPPLLTSIFPLLALSLLSIRTQSILDSLSASVKSPTLLLALDSWPAPPPTFYSLPKSPPILNSIIYYWIIINYSINCWVYSIETTNSIIHLGYPVSSLIIRIQSRRLFHPHQGLQL